MQTNCVVPAHSGKQKEMKKKMKQEKKETSKQNFKDFITFYTLKFYFSAK